MSIDRPDSLQAANGERIGAMLYLLSLALPRCPTIATPYHFSQGSCTLTHTVCSDISCLTTCVLALLDLVDSVGIDLPPSRGTLKGY